MNTIFGPRQVSARSGVLQQSLRDHSRVAYKAAIVAAAESVILKNGFKQTKVADIAEASGVSVGTLYNYFKSKEAVMQAIVSHRREQLRTELEQPFDSPDPLDQLRQWVVRVHAYIEKNGELLRLHARTKVDPSAWLSQFPDFDATRPGLDARLDACARRREVDLLSCIFPRPSSGRWSGSSLASWASPFGHRLPRTKCTRCSQGSASPSSRMTTLRESPPKRPLSLPPRNGS